MDTASLVSMVVSCTAIISATLVGRWWLLRGSRHRPALPFEVAPLGDYIAQINRDVAALASVTTGAGKDASPATDD